MNPSLTADWRTWDATERDAGTGFDVVYPRFRDRHLGQRWRQAVGVDVDFDDASPVTTGGWTTMVTSRIWIPPWADVLIVPLTMAIALVSTTPPNAATLQVRVTIGGSVGRADLGAWYAEIELGDFSPLIGEDGDLDAGGINTLFAGDRRVAYWAVPTSGSWLDTEQEIKLQYSTGTNTSRVLVFNGPQAADSAGNTGYGRPWRWEE